MIGIRKALFSSWPALELQEWRRRRMSPRIREAQQIRWELQHGAIYDPRIDRGENVAPVPLGESEVSWRRSRLTELMHVHWTKRGLATCWPARRASSPGRGC